MIDATNVRLRYADGTEAVRGVDLRVPEGEFFGFLGPNGAGKTTTIKTLTTLLRPTSGTVTLNGFDVTDDPQSVHRSIGYMAQETSIDEELTARENVRFACEAYGVPRNERTDRVDELLDLVSLTDVADKQADGFSGGMKKRLDVATVLVHRPPLVFLDEPTTGLDPKARLDLWEYFREINRQGTTVFLTTQYLEEADELCDRLSVIQDGRIVATDSPQALKSEVGGDILTIDFEEVRAGEHTDDEQARARRTVRESGFVDDATVETTPDGISVTARNVRQVGTDLLIALRDAGFSVVGFDIRSPTLDDVFLAITGERTSDEPAPEDDAAAMEVRA